MELFLLSDVEYDQFGVVTWHRKRQKVGFRHFGDISEMAKSE
jgi:hypothetical protein